MDAIPPNLSQEGRKTTGLVCPDCYGVLEAETVGSRGHLQFICRIGHTYSLPELLVSKESDLEHRAWSAILAAEEMARLMGDLIRDGRADGAPAGEFDRRRQSARTLAGAFRAALRNDRPLELRESEGSQVGDPPDSHA